MQYPEVRTKNKKHDRYQNLHNVNQRNLFVTIVSMTFHIFCLDIKFDAAVHVLKYRITKCAVL